jgi:hypothetical protein
MWIRHVILALLLSPLQAQIPDLDDFSRDLELTLPGEETEPIAEADGLPRHHLFSGWDFIKPYLSWSHDSRDETIVHLLLPEGSYLVAPNVAGVATGYQRISELLRAGHLTSGGMLKVVLHADGNYSTALLLSEAPTQPVPPGLDISPLKKTHVMGLITDIQVLEKSSPLLLNAFVRLQQEASRNGWTLDRREFIFLPTEPGRVFFGLELLAPLPGGNSLKRD